MSPTFPLDLFIQLLPVPGLYLFIVYVHVLCIYAYMHLINPKEWFSWGKIV